MLMREDGTIGKAYGYQIAKYNQDGKDWANGHLNALKEAGILKNITPNMLELRGRVLLMLQRSTVAK